MTKKRDPIAEMERLCESVLAEQEKYRRDTEETIAYNLKELSNKKLVEELTLEVQRLTEYCETSGGTPDELFAISVSERTIELMKAEALRRMRKGS